MTALLTTDLPFPKYQGKVRDTYDLGDGRMLMIATDRISAFDVVMDDGIPDKGLILTQLSAFWFERTDGVVPNHFLRVADGSAADELPLELPPELRHRTTICRQADPIRFECIARGYISGSAWQAYQQTGSMWGEFVPQAMKESERLPEAIFTVTTKEETGHDLPISYQQFEDLAGPNEALVMKLRTLALYRYAHDVALESGIIVADTKVEFGRLDGEIIVIDELVTPDSSRFWPLDAYEAGKGQPSFDKQYLRDWLTSSGWNKEPPPPRLPDELIQGTATRYEEAFEQITGQKLRR